MEQLKVKKKDTIITNVLIYLCLSFFFLYIQHAYRHHLSPFSVVYFKKSFELFWYVAIYLGAASFLIYHHHRMSLLIYKIGVFLVGFKVVEGLFVEFNKIIVIAMFFYIVISYFLYQLLKFYLELASINPNYADSDLFPPLLREIRCKINSDDFEIDGHLSNWDPDGCFIKMNEPRNISDKVKVTIYFRDREFSEHGEVVAVTTDSSGVGIKFEKTAKEISTFNWAEFMEIAHELGFQPERLR